jgi:CarD family transcriptional regulator
MATKNTRAVASKKPATKSSASKASVATKAPAKTASASSKAPAKAAKAPASSAKTTKVAKAPAKQVLAKKVAQPTVKPSAKALAAAKQSPKSTAAKPVLAKMASKNGSKVSSKAPSKAETQLVKTQSVKASMHSSVKAGQKKVEVKKPEMVKAAAPVVSKSAESALMKQYGFNVGDHVVYPTHGVGKILGLEVERVGDFELKVFVITFEKDKMTLRVPVGRAQTAGLRPISSLDQITRAIQTLKGRAKIARGMWSRRAQEYESKINSGNILQIAEVVRDLHKNVDQSERSYSERMIYETALHRLSGELAASERVDLKIAQDKLLKLLRKQVAEQEAAAA